MSKTNWLDDLDHDLAVKDLSPYTRCNMRKLIAAVRLAEKTLAYQWSMPGTRARELKDTALARLRSGDVEEKP